MVLCKPDRAGRGRHHRRPELRRRRAGRLWLLRPIRSARYQRRGRRDPIRAVGQHLLCRVQQVDRRDCRRLPQAGQLHLGRLWRRLPDQQRWRSDRSVRQAGQPLDLDAVLRFHHCPTCSASPFHRRPMRPAPTIVTPSATATRSSTTIPSWACGPMAITSATTSSTTARPSPAAKSVRFDRTKMLAGDWLPPSNASNSAPATAACCRPISTARPRLRPVRRTSS